MSSFVVISKGGLGEPIVECSIEMDDKGATKIATGMEMQGEKIAGML